ncbi:hypothetical protein RFM23_27920 [Mesorhizobium abyssinicae]|uniref:Uncharacterized protein n=1 Tax=Mesorhizobium abyssinicae TaxID=1209958 RepID=A0ABU5AVW1_9HYPH|nr:hypothetical protein [Mesorhizobium abyssinicae]MDX8541455.1 hypothetical protein [Mesorhizobium abyssinicae]
MDILDKLVIDLEEAAEACQTSCEMVVQQQAVIFSDPDMMKAAISQLYRQQVVIHRNIALVGTMLQAIRDGVTIPTVPN